MSREVTEMMKLAALLVENGIQFETRMNRMPASMFSTELVDYPQLIIKDGYSDWICDAVCFPGTYGFEQGLLEIMAHGRYENIVLGEGHLDEVDGWLTAEKAFEYFKKGWEARRGKTEDSVES
jgi:hypothetical protein